MSNIFLSKQRMSNVKHCLHVYLKYYNRNRIAISLRMQPIYGMKKDEKIITSHVASSLHDRIRKSSKQICFCHEKKENYNIQDIWNNCLDVAKYFKLLLQGVFFLWIQSGGCKSAILRSFMLFFYFLHSKIWAHFHFGTFDP